MKSLEVVNEFKITASYGVTGNFQIPNYGSIGIFGQGLYPDGNNTNPAIYPQTFSNADLGWETTKQTNFGADFAFLEDRIYGSFDTYNSATEALLLFVGVPASTGFTTALKNIGKVNNKGLEFNLTSRNLSGELSWSTDFNYSTNKNEVIALGGKNEPIYSKGSAGVRHITRVGDAVGSYFGWVVEGVYQSQSEIDSAPTDKMAKAPRPGDFRFKDINGSTPDTSLYLNIIWVPIIGWVPDLEIFSENSKAPDKFDLSDKPIDWILFVLQKSLRLSNIRNLFLFKLWRRNI